MHFQPHNSTYDSSDNEPPHISPHSLTEAVLHRPLRDLALQQGSLDIAITAMLYPPHT
jgi:hypothetical protein